MNVKTKNRRVNFSREDQEHCKVVLAEIKNKLPYYYVEPVLKKLHDKGIKNITSQEIINVKNGVRTDRQIVNLLREVANEFNQNRK